MIPVRLIHRILADYSLPAGGVHGVAHWARVLENGLRLAERTGARVEVVQLFAVFHDSRRVNEGWDEGHGRRGAEFAAKLRGEFFQLADDDFDLLYAACADHTEGRTEADVTIQTCWDADRLDLGRVGMRPEPLYLCTPAAKDPAMIRWADGRGSMGFVPEIVTSTWGLGSKFEVSLRSRTELTW
ncbi:MAG TPA: hypothetical protein VML55_24955 [Planctomycetaceae bacterium]|nr:hypothetical protein [Planctomycetaceae bacterium]